MFDDHRVPRRTLEEIEAEADRCRSRIEVDADGRIDLYAVLRAWKIELVVRSDTEMGEDEAYSVADKQQIYCRSSIADGLKFGEPYARYVVGHEIGHMFLHRGEAPKARKINGNKKYNFIADEESGEQQAWSFARALFVTRDNLVSSETDEELAIRVGIPTDAVAKRREEVRKALSSKGPRLALFAATEFLANARRDAEREEAARKAAARQDLAKHTAWARAALILGENPAKVRSARGYRVEWAHYGRADSQVGWTIRDGEARSLFDLLAG